LVMRLTASLPHMSRDRGRYAPSDHHSTCQAKIKKSTMRDFLPSTGLSAARDAV
jgi:hypothetical protein